MPKATERKPAAEPKGLSIGSPRLAGGRSLLEQPCLGLDFECSGHEERLLSGLGNRERAQLAGLLEELALSLGDEAEERPPGPRPRRRPQN